MIQRRDREHHGGPLRFDTLQKIRVPNKCFLENCRRADAQRSVNPWRPNEKCGPEVPSTRSALVILQSGMDTLSRKARNAA